MASSTVGAVEKNLYEQVIDVLNSIFGSHPGYRPVHAKGVLYEGTFRATETARSLTRAPHMQGQSVPITVRFSNFIGVPVVRDSDPMASPHGMAIRFQLEGNASTDIVAHSYNGFPARDAKEFLAFLRALASSSPDAPKPTPLDTFLSGHPAAKLFVETPKPAPQSFATTSYYAVDSFRFINREGRSQFGRYRVVPVAGEQYLNDSEAAKRDDNYLFDELAERLSRHPAEFRLVAQLAGEGDPIEDPTRSWPEERPQIELGVLAVTKPLANDKAVQRTIAFDPARLPDGIEPGDPLIEVRSVIYALSLRRRQR
ncbi:MAG: catalase family peroxidase [Bryobacteraceae bacterium]